MSSRSKISLPQANKTSKLRKSSTVTSIQNEKRRSTSNLLDGEEAKISDILKTYTNSPNSVLDIRIIMQSDIFSSGGRYKNGEDDLDESRKVSYITEEYNKPILYCYGRNETEGPLRMLFKNGLDKYVAPVLNLLIPYFRNLLILQLPYCELRDTQFSLLLSILNKNVNIKSLSLEGNPLSTQCYSDLFKTQLVHLSLRSCKITLLGIENIVKRLQDSVLTSLNLSSNYLDDECLQRLSCPLRLNRRLSSLNLADNWFTDTGLIDFIKVFTKFKLVHNEIIKRRNANMEYLHEHQELVRELLSSGFQAKQSIVSTKVLRSPVKINNTYRPSSTLSLSQNKAFSKARANILIQEKISAKITKDGNPLIIECHASDKAIYCHGNFILTNLNVSYNKLTSRSLIEFIEVLRYQSEFTNDNKWLLKLECDDSLTNKYPLEWLQITEFLKANDIYNKLRPSDRNRVGSTVGAIRLG